MGFLERIGLAPKRARPVGQQLEKPRDERGARRKNALVKGAIFAWLVAMTLAAFPKSEVYQYTVQVGEQWREETLTAPFDFALYKAPEALEAERREVRFRTPPFFREVPDVRERMAANRDTVARQLSRILEAYAAFQRAQQRGRAEEAARDSLRYLRLRRRARLRLAPAQWDRLARSYAESQSPPAADSQAVEAGPPLSERLLQQAWQVGAQMANFGVIDVPRDSVLTDFVVIRRPGEPDQTRNKDNLYGLNEAYAYAQDQLSEVYTEDPELAALAAAFYRALFQPTLEYLRGETLQEWQRREQRISPTQGMVQQGTTIAEAGQRVTPEIKRQLASLERARQERGGSKLLWKTLLGQLMLVLATYLIFFLYLYLLRRRIFNDNGKVLLIALIFGGIVGLFATALRAPEMAMYVVPVAIASVLLTVIFDSRVGLFGTITLALIGGHLLRYDLEFAFATIFAGTLGVLSVRDIKNRGQFFISAGLVFVAYLFVLGASYFLQDLAEERFLQDLLQVGINSILLVMAYPLLWVFERTFDVTTDLTLLELSDTNRPLLKELSLRAPGTFNHVLQVANLAEAAADAVGANALLTRVGALYHDVGKMLKPEYFVENQRSGQNPHDALKPRMSALIIASHVKEGLEMGRQYNLPERVLRFIPMHHGSTRIEYFYRKALDQRQEGDPPLLDADFRYPGPRPDSKETGILMLADSVEAASRSLSEPTHKRLQTLVDMIFKARSEDGQLDDTELTFRDLNRIKATFLSMLMAIYHVRMKYPGQEEEKEKETPRPEPPKPEPEPLRHRLEEKGLVGIPEQSIRVVPAEEKEDDELHEREQENGHLPTVGNPGRRAQSDDEKTPGDGAAKRTSERAPERTSEPDAPSKEPRR